jgi:hypothetical protein
MHYLKSMILVVSVFLFVNVSMAEAEPTSNMHYLMNDSVSMLDWGLFQVNHDLEGYIDIKNEIKDAIGFITNVSYDWEENRIIIRLMLEGASSKEQAKEWCKILVNKTRRIFDINPDTGKPSMEKTSTLYTCFTHTEFKRKLEPEGLSKELDNITVIKVQALIKDFKGVATCQAPLLGTSIMFEEK